MSRDQLVRQLDGTRQVILGKGGEYLLVLAIGLHQHGFAGGPAKLRQPPQADARERHAGHQPHAVLAQPSAHELPLFLLIHVLVHDSSSNILCTRCGNSAGGHSL